MELAGGDVRVYSKHFSCRKCHGLPAVKLSLCFCSGFCGVLNFLVPLALKQMERASSPLVQSEIESLKLPSGTVLCIETHRKRLYVKFLSMT